MTINNDLKQMLGAAVAGILIGYFLAPSQPIINNHLFPEPKQEAKNKPISLVKTKKKKN